ncbi:MAG: hypothetical protein WD696_04300 [Bryobacteraceae bacterium]
MKLALIGYGNVGRALARLIRRKRRDYPFRITGIHTARHGTAISSRGLPVQPPFGPAAPCIEAFLDAAQAEIAVELTTLNPVSGNSTSKIAIETMEAGGTLAEGVEKARAMGIAEADASYDLEGWDSSAKTAALANVLMDARVTPQSIDTKGITRLMPERVREIARSGKTVRIVSRARGSRTGVSLRVRAEVLDRNDVLAAVPGTSNLLLLHTDLMGAIGTVSISPAVEQTACGVWFDLIDIARRF